MGLPRRGPADVRRMAFLSAAAPSVRSFLELRTPVVENHPSLALSHAISIQAGIKAGGKLHRPGGGAPGAGLGDSYCTMSHTYYIRADQEHSNATQAQICPHRLEKGVSVGDSSGGTSWNLQNNLATPQRFLLSYIPQGLCHHHCHHHHH